MLARLVKPHIVCVRRFTLASHHRNQHKSTDKEQDGEQNAASSEFSSFVDDLNKLRGKQNLQTPVKKEFQNNHEDIKKATMDVILNSKPKTMYTDLENTSLNLNLKNSVLVDSIQKHLRYRMNHRFENMSTKWLEEFERIVETLPPHAFKGKKGSKTDIIRQEFTSYFSNISMSASKVGQPISVGDLVILQEGSTEFYMTAACPEDFDANHYTFINSKGKIYFGYKSSIRFRFPRFVPEYFIPIIKSMVMLEEKTLDVSPVGIMDKEASKSEEAKPKQLRQSKIHTQLEDPDTSAIADEEHEDFISNQVSNRLLRNSDINTYVVPASARDLYSKLLTNVSNESMKKFRDFSWKLELLHRVLQYDENGDIHGSPKVVSIFQILHLLNKINNKDIKSLLENFNEDELIRLRTTLLVSSDKEASSLGKIIHTTDRLDAIERGNYQLSSYFATILLLRKQTRLWKINEQNSINPVTSIIVLPISYKISRDKLSSYLKTNSNNITQYMIGKINGNEGLEKPEYYDETIGLLKDFIIDNLRNDYELETLCASLIRVIDETLDFGDIYLYEYGKSKAYDILQALGESEFENPVKWSWGLEQNSFKTSLNEEYLSILEEKQQNSSDDLYDEDPMAQIREDYEEPIFCIDSESAHEIDDGISLRENDEKYVVAIHIANPSSYIKPTSTLSQIAFNKATTSYLPEGPLKMFPDLVSDVSGLGVEGKWTRTFAIEFDLPKDFEHRDIGELKQLIESSSRVKFYNTNNYPLGYTYKKVHLVLNGEEDKYRSKLEILFEISQKLKQIRIEEGKAHEFEQSNSELKVKHLETKQPSSFAIGKEGYTLRKENVEIFLGFTEKQLKSTSLVTEMMITCNYLTGLIGKKQKLPLVYRNQIMNIGETLQKQIRALNKNDLKDKLKILSVMNSAKVDIAIRGHESLGVPTYCQITSPLRRYSDLVNQWILQAHFNQDPKPMSLSNIVSHLQAREIINKQLSRVSDRFWKGIFLREYFKLKPSLSLEEQIEFKMHFGRILGDDRVQMDLENFTSFSGVVEGVDRNADRIRTKNVEIRRVDFMENELLFSLVDR